MRATCRTDHTLTSELVSPKFENFQFDTIAQWNWDLSCKKNWLNEIRGRPVERMLQFTFKLIFVEMKPPEFDTFPKWFGNSTCQKKRNLAKIEAKMYTDYTLAFEFVAAENKFGQIDTITQWNWDLSCQKKWIKEIWGRPVARILHLPWSLLESR